MSASHVGGDVLLHHVHVVVAPVKLPLLPGVVDADQEALGLSAALSFVEPMTRTHASTARTQMRRFWGPNRCGWLHPHDTYIGRCGAGQAGLGHEERPRPTDTAAVRAPPVHFSVSK